MLRPSRNWLIITVLPFPVPLFLVTHPILTMNEKKNYGFTTTILHSDRQKAIEHGSLHKPIHTSVAFGYKDARQLAEVFQGKQSGYRYGRQGNPTVSALEDKVTRMEGAFDNLLRDRHGCHRRRDPGAAARRRPRGLVGFPVR